VRRRRLAAAAALTATATATLAMVSTGAPITVRAATLDSYKATAQSWGLDAQVIAIQLAGTFPDLADEYFPHTVAQVDSLPHAQADGEFFDPGGTVRVGPGEGNGILLGPAGVPPLLPNYPYIAQTTSDANNKRDVDASTSQNFTPEPGVLPILTIPGLPLGSTLTGFGAGTSHAHADTSPYADALGAVAGVNLGLVSMGSSSGESMARQKGGTVTTTSTTSMKDITVAGVLHIADAAVTASITTAGAGTTKTTQQVTYSGVTVAGVAATLDDQGLHVGGQGVPATIAQTAVDALNKALATFKATLVAATATSVIKPDGSATATVDGVELVVTDNQNYRVQLSLGHADAVARAVVALPKVPLPSLPPETFAPLPVDQFPAAAPPIASVAPVTTPRTARKPLPVKTADGSLVLVSASNHHMLILPLVAVFAELCLIALCVAAYRWKRQLDESPEDLLAL
jgi:hypothetical protein